MDVKGSTAGVKDIHGLHKEWDDISCPICMDHPHNAVLIICSSHEKGCRSYICDTSYRHSNCLDRFKKLKANESDSNAYQLGSSLNDADIGLQGNLAETGENYNRSIGGEERHTGSSARTLLGGNSNNNNEGEEISLFNQSGGGGRGNPCGPNKLKCPLCRGSVIGWIVVKEARQYLDLKTRSCSRESCSFSGNYRGLRRHARRVHPATRPSDVDPSRLRAWRRLEHQTEYGDVLSAIGASPGALVLGDYIIDNGGDEGVNSRRNLWTTLFLFQMMGSPIRRSSEQEQAGVFPSSSSRSWRTHRRPSAGYHRSILRLRDNSEEDGYLDDDRPIPRRRRRFTRSRPDDRRS